MNRLEIAALAVTCAVAGFMLGCAWYRYCAGALLKALVASGRLCLEDISAQIADEEAKLARGRRR